MKSRFLAIVTLFSVAALLVVGDIKFERLFTVQADQRYEVRPNDFTFLTVNPVNIPFVEERELEKYEPFTIAFTGDILLDDVVGKGIAEQGIDYPFKAVSSLLKNADLTVGNLETSVSTRGTPQDKEYTYQSKPETLQSLVDSGYDMVSISNNHTLDYGVDALHDTIENLKAYNIGYSGAGMDEAQAFQAYYKEINGKTVAILGLSRVLPDVSWYAGKDTPGLSHAYNMEPMMSYVKEAVANSDYTVIMIHWNKEREDYPEEYAKEMARAFVDAGVDTVIGSHPHTLQGIEFYKDRPIYYSLGNFVFPSNPTTKTSETIIVSITYEDDTFSSSIVPAKILRGQPILMDEEYNQRIIRKLNDISFNATIDGKGIVSQK